ncbi:hypothetical protein KC19_VG034200 [Ceratodon purpureus]|uniref:Uncharacterized protein n=1 Tax=Ceratodon purpureus TaxID=3225 RepID=A0A8T0HLZ6_CERPU|nr:hypothetical protein KC19_VG034200 [Ceratodon purpureus]
MEYKQEKWRIMEQVKMAAEREGRWAGHRLEQDEDGGRGSAQMSGLIHHLSQIILRRLEHNCGFGFLGRASFWIGASTAWEGCLTKVTYVQWNRRFRGLSSVVKVILQVLIFVIFSIAILRQSLGGPCKDLVARQTDSHSGLTMVSETQSSPTSDNNGHQGNDQDEDRGGSRHGDANVANTGKERDAGLESNGRTCVRRGGMRGRRVGGRGRQGISIDMRHWSTRAASSRATESIEAWRNESQASPLTSAPKRRCARTRPVDIEGTFACQELNGPLLDPVLDGRVHDMPNLARSPKGEIRERFYLDSTAVDCGDGEAHASDELVGSQIPRTRIQCGMDVLQPQV